MADLSDRQRRFVDGVLQGKSLTDAYRAAGYRTAAGHSTDSAASRLLRNVDVAKALEAGRAACRVSSRATVEWVIGGLCDEAEATGEGTSQSARVRARELVGKWLGLFVDKSEVTTNVNVHVNLTSDERRSAVLRILGPLAEAGPRPDTDRQLPAS